MSCREYGPSLFPARLKFRLMQDSAAAAVAKTSAFGAIQGSKQDSRKDKHSSASEAPVRNLDGVCTKYLRRDGIVYIICMIEVT